MGISVQDISDLWIRFQKEHDEKAFSELYCLFYDELLTYGFRICEDKDAVEDCIQDLFLKIYQRRVVLRESSKLRPFLLHALRNMLYNQLSRSSRFRSLSDEDLAFHLSCSLGEEDSPAEHPDLTDEIRSFLKGLTERQKEVIYLRFAYDMDFEEIAVTMGINVQSVHNLLFRSMQKMRKNAPLLFLVFMHVV